MAEKVTLEVEGADTLGRTLHGAADDLDDLETAAGQTGRLAVQRAQGRAPKASGDLARSITADVSGSTVSVGSGLVYAPVINFGWAAHNISPNPFLLPAITDSESIWVGFYEKDIQSKLEKVRGT